MRSPAVGTCVGKPTFGRLIMDAETLESWRQIETYRRLGKDRQLLGAGTHSAKSAGAPANGANGTPSPGKDRT